MSNFHPLEVVGLGSETQLQVGENLNYETKRSMFRIILLSLRLTVGRIYLSAVNVLLPYFTM